MKEYKRMWKIINGEIEEIAVSMITKNNKIKYYPIKNKKVFKNLGIQEGWYESRYYSFANTIEEANTIAMQYNMKILIDKLKLKEEMSLKIPYKLKRLKEEYLNEFKKAKNTELLLEKEIKELKEQIEELKRS